MGSNWINALDNCAAGGVLDFDAAAWLLEQPQRFVGSPSMEGMPSIRQPLLLPPGIKMNGQLNSDQFGSNSDVVNNPTWKKVLFGAVIIGGAIAGIFGLSKIFLKGKSTAHSTGIKDFVKTIINTVKSPIKWITKKLNIKKP